MTRVGCIVWASLFVALTCLGVWMALRRGTSILTGIGFGVAAGLAVTSGFLTIVDAWERVRRPGLIGVPRWVVVLVGTVFVLASAAAVVMFNRL